MKKMPLAYSHLRKRKVICSNRVTVINSPRPQDPSKASRRFIDCATNDIAPTASWYLYCTSTLPKYCTDGRVSAIRNPHRVPKLLEAGLSCTDTPPPPPHSHLHGEHVHYGTRTYCTVNHARAAAPLWHSNCFHNSHLSEKRSTAGCFVGL